MITMLFYIERSSDEKGGKDKKSSKDQGNEKPVPGLLAVLACACTVGISGYLSMKINDPDMGKVVTLQEMAVRMEREAERIKNDPLMPPQAKAMALQALSRSKSVGRQSAPKSKVQ